VDPLDLSRFCELIHDRSGLDFPPSRRADLEDVIAKTVARHGMPNPPALFAKLSDGPVGEAILQAMIVDLTVGETYFFRNEPQFQALERQILPELIARRRSTRQLRLWSAGCASGEEPYSLAILLERLLPDLADWNVLILATDINPQVLARAERGCFGEWSFRQMPAEIREKYFVPCGTELELHPRVRSRVTFARLNLVEDAFPSILTHTRELDLILCRNVLIYFREETVRRIVDRFYHCLAEDGWLVVGHAEPSQSVFGQFASYNFPGTVTYRKGRADGGAAMPLPQTAAPAIRAPRPFERVRRRAVVEPEPRVDRTGRAWSATATAGTAEPSAYQRAKWLADRMQWDDAEACIATALAQTPLSAPAHYLHGLILLEKGQSAAALAALRSCVFAEPDFVLGHMAMADLFDRQGQKERARKALEIAGRLAATRPADEAIPEGDGLTSGRLVEIVRMKKQQ
jgi:chemotaxis protein methyltransferase CheR